MSDERTSETFLPFSHRIGRRLLEENTSSSFTVSQPSFIALISIIVALVVAIIIAILILCYRHYAHRRHRLRQKFQGKRQINQSQLATSDTPSSTPTYSIRSSRRLVSPPPPLLHPTNSSLGHSISTIPSRRLQQSSINAYLTDMNSNPLDPKQLNSYLFIDLHSTSSETFPVERFAKKRIQEINTTTSGYDTSTCGEDKTDHHSFKHRRRRLPYYQRQRRRSTTLAFKRSTAPRFLMRERSLPNHLLRLPQLRHQRRSMTLRDQRNSSRTTTINSDLISTSLSTTTDDYEDSHAYRVNRMKTIEEEKISMINSPHIRPNYFFEKVSTSRGDESDMVIYDDIPMPLKTSPKLADGIVYINDSIIV